MDKLSRFQTDEMRPVRRLSQAGYLLSTLGLVLVGLGVGRLVNVWQGAGAVSAVLLAVLLSGLLLGGSGFTLLVLGSDPWEETDSDSWRSPSAESVDDASPVRNPHWELRRGGGEAAPASEFAAEADA